MEKINEVIEIINGMDIKDKLRLAICIIQSNWIGLIYNTKKIMKNLILCLKN